MILERLNSDTTFRDYFEQETTELPEFYFNSIKTDLGPLWGWLPDGAIYHDHNAYLKSDMERIAV